MEKLNCKIRVANNFPIDGGEIESGSDFMRLRDSIREEIGGFDERDFEFTAVQNHRQKTVRVKIEIVMESSNYYRERVLVLGGEISDDEKSFKKSFDDDHTNYDQKEYEKEMGNFVDKFEEHPRAMAQAYANLMKNS